MAACPKWVALARSLCSQLTSLCIWDMLGRCEPPAALAGLSRLQRCCLGPAEDLGALPPQAQLPAGPWAGSLRVLGANSDVLQRSMALLSAATQLQHLAVTGGTYTQLGGNFWEWAGSHPSLLHLELHVVQSSDVPGHILHSALALNAARPSLHVTSSEGARFYGRFKFDL